MRNDIPAEEIKDAAMEMFHRALEEAGWYEMIGSPELAERAKGRAMGALELRDLIMPFENYGVDKNDDDMPLDIA